MGRQGGCNTCVNHLGHATSDVLLQALQPLLRRIKEHQSQPQQHHPTTTNQQVPQPAARQQPQCLHLAVAISTDGVMPFKKSMGNKAGHTYYPIVLVNLSLPPWARMQPSMLIVVGIVPGPSPKQLQSFMSPLIDELRLNQYIPWVVNRDDAPPLHISIHACMVLADYRAIVKVDVTPQVPSILNACFDCKQIGVRAVNKTIYGQHFRLLPQRHPLRRQAYNLNRQRRPNATTGEMPRPPSVADRPFPTKTLEERRMISSVTGVKVQLKTAETNGSIVVRNGLYQLDNFDPRSFSVYDPMHSIGGGVEQIFIMLSSASRFTEAALRYEHEENQ